MIQMIRNLWAELKFRLTDPTWWIVPPWVVLVVILLIVMVFVSFVTPLMVKQITYGMIFFVWFFSFFVAVMASVAIRILGDALFKRSLAAQNRPPKND